jgi:hypothetical protein
LTSIRDIQSLRDAWTQCANSAHFPTARPEGEIDPKPVGVRHVATAPPA